MNAGRASRAPIGAGNISAAALAALFLGGCGQVVTERSIDSVLYVDSTDALVLVNSHRTREHGMTAAEALSGSFTGYLVDYRSKRPAEVAFQHDLPRVTSADGIGLGDSVFLFTGRKEAYVYDIRTGKLTTLAFSEEGISPGSLLRWSSPDSVLMTQNRGFGSEPPEYALLSLSTGNVRRLELSGFFGPSAAAPKMLIPFGRILVGIFASEGVIDSIKVRHIDSSAIRDAAIPPYPVAGYPSPVLGMWAAGGETFLTLTLGPGRYRMPLRSPETLGEGRWEATPEHPLKCNPSLSHFYRINDDNSLTFHRSDSSISATYDLLR